ncbi:MAG: M15 family metallopeptidase [Myxococcota bacterium]
MTNRKTAALSWLLASTLIACTHLQQTQKKKPTELFLAPHMLFATCPSETQTMQTVEYLDFHKIKRQASLSVLKTQKNVFKKLFADLLSQEYPIFSLATLQRSNDIERFFSENRSFVACTQDNQPVLFINPLQNPVLLGVKSKSQQRQVRIYPRNAFLNVTRYSQRKGTITKDVLKLFSQNGFHLLLSDTDKAFLGAFVHQTQPIHQQDKTAHKNSDTPAVQHTQIKPNFTFGPLSKTQKEQLKALGWWAKGCPVALERLNHVSFTHHSPNGPQQGGIIVLDVLAPYVAEAMREFYQEDIVLRNATPTPAVGFQLDSMTVAFNCRAITGGGSHSLHSYGTSIDFNTMENPYIGIYNLDKKLPYIQGKVLPPSPLNNLVRNVLGTKDAEIMKSIMLKKGFTWGGEWSDRIDYMHFQVGRFVSTLLSMLDKEGGAGFYRIARHQPQIEKWVRPQKWAYLYKLYGQGFLNALERHKSQIAQLSDFDFFNLILEDLEKQNEYTSKQNATHQTPVSIGSGV